ncbi:MAG: hypothetical protein ABL959_01150 [Pyrinomonadaceae bacterium]
MRSLILKHANSGRTATFALREMFGTGGTSLDRSSLTQCLSMREMYGTVERSISRIVPCLVFIAVGNAWNDGTFDADDTFSPPISPL